MSGKLTRPVNVVHDQTGQFYEIWNQFYKTIILRTTTKNNYALHS